VTIFAITACGEYPLIPWPLLPLRSEERRRGCKEEPSPFILSQWERARQRRGEGSKLGSKTATQGFRGLKILNNKYFILEKYI